MITVCIDGNVLDTRAAFELHCRLLAAREEIIHSGEGECVLDVRSVKRLCDRAKWALDGFQYWLTLHGASFCILF